MMEIARYADGQPLICDEETGSLRVGPFGVTVSQVMAYDRNGMLSWVSPKHRAWWYELLEDRNRSTIAAKRASWSFGIGAACIVGVVLVAVIGTLDPAQSWAPEHSVLRALFGCFLLVLACLLVPGSPISLVLGVRGLQSHRRRLAIAGIIMNAVSLVLLLSVVFYAMGGVAALKDLTARDVQNTFQFDGPVAFEDAWTHQ
jgi:hypothetical protein